MSEKIGFKRLCEQAQELIDEVHGFHEEKNPGNFYSNHADVVVSTVVGLVNKCIILPYTGIQSWDTGISENLKGVMLFGTLEVFCFILLVAYFSPMKKTELIKLFSSTGFRKTAIKMTAGYGKAAVIRWPYLYILIKGFPDACPKTYFHIINTSFLVQSALRGIA